MADDNSEPNIVIDPTTGEKKDKKLQQDETEPGPAPDNTYRANLPKAIFVVSKIRETFLVYFRKTWYFNTSKYQIIIFYVYSKHMGNVHVFSVA